MDKIKSKETVINVTSCKKANECRDRLLATVALKSITKYRRRVKFDGGGV